MARSCGRARLQADENRGSARHTETLRCAAARNRNLEVIAAAKQRTHGAALCLRVRVDERCGMMAGDLDLNRAARR